MIKWLVNLGLVVTPYLVWRGFDTRTPKEAAAIFIAVLISLSAIYTCSLKKINNRWMYIFIGWLFISMFLAPRFDNFRLVYFNNLKDFRLLDRSIANFWNYKAILYAIIYFLTIHAISGISLTRRLVKIVSWCGLLMGVYVILQNFGLDQFFSINKNDPNYGGVTKALLAGTLGQPTIVSPYIGLTIPFMLYDRKWLWGMVGFIAICLTRSQIAVGATVLGLLIYLVFFNFRKWKLVLVSTVLILGILGLFQYVKTHSGCDNGRKLAWTTIWKDMNTPPLIRGNRLTITGFSPGSFEWTHSIRFQNLWRKAHNEYLQVWYDLGFIGLGIVLLMLFEFYRQVLNYWKRRRDKRVVLLISSFTVIVICNFFTFLWHLGTFQFYTVVLVGLTYNILQEDNYEFR